MIVLGYYAIKVQMVTTKYYQEGIDTEQPVIAYWKLTIETLEQGVKYLQS